ncbi:transcriptional regulator [Photorhabdus temperata J3]|uniref:Transcriptional regulator n=2 Tax=Photorhabdus TaxID=29487 RepID=U7QQX7_PHOTE|nr:transcriptional regulator [Photorhabdus temperata J3]
MMSEIMKDKSMSFSVNKDLDVYSKSFDAFISYMENSNDFWIIKDNESRFIYANDIMIYYSGLPKGFNIEGKLDSECPAPWSEFEDIIQANDKNVMISKKTIPVLNTFTYGGKEKIIQPFMVNITPLIKDGKCIGVVGHGKKLELYSMYHFENNRHPDSLTFGTPTDLFTDREFDIVFFALQSLSAKDIARKLDISYRTVQTRLQIIYQKIGINSLSQLKEYCRGKGYDNYAPTRFINPNPYIPLA